MSKPKVVLFDADGVITLPEEFFTQIYAKSRGLDPEPFERFFRDQFPAARVGKADLKNLIESNPGLWQWEKSTAELLTYWFESENVRNEPLLEVIAGLRRRGVKCYVATNQDKYRGEYFRNVMFKDEFDGYFVSAELGFEKPNPDFFGAIIVLLKNDNPELEPGEIMFVDDSFSNIDAASSVGIVSVRYEDIDTITSLLAKLDREG